MKSLLITLTALLWVICLSAQIQVDPTITAEDAVNNILLGAGVQAENITFSGDLNQIGSFVSNGSNMPIDSGLVLGTGNVNFASSAGFGAEDDPGPGGNNNGGGSLGGGNFGIGDPDLQEIANVDVNDAAILEFDFDATGDSIQFNFVFASEEYPEYVCGTVNDAFGFFLSGPGIDGGGVFEDNAVNLAQIPETDPPVPVTINSVNPGVVGGNGTQQNCDDIDINWPDYNIYYIANETITTDPDVIEYDGFTVVLTARAAVECGESYHIKMAIADGGDTAFDSAVFLESGSFESNAVFVDGSASVGGSLVFAGDSIVVEGCNDAQFTFFRPNTDDADTILFEVLGSATEGLDYTLLPDTVFIEEGENIVTVPFEAFEDDETEPVESIIVRYIYENSCEEIDTAETILYIADYIDPTVSLEDTTVPCPGESVEITPVTTGFGGFTYNWSNDTEGESLIDDPEETTTYTLTVTDVCGFTASADVTINVVDWPDLVLTPIPGTSLCPGDEVEIGVDVTGGSPGYTYDWLIGGNQSTNSVNPDITTDYTVFVSDQCETQQIEVTATVVPWPGLEITPIAAFSECPGSPVTIGVTVTGGFPEYSYDWTGASENASEVTVSPFSNNSYSVTVSDQCSSQEQVVLVEVAQLEPITAIYEDTLCVGDTEIFEELMGGSGGNYFTSVFLDGDSLVLDDVDINPVGETFSYSGNEEGFYTIVIQDQCPTVTPLEAVVFFGTCDTFIPNVFTPDQAGSGSENYNERFIILGIQDFPNSRLVVYNRWGGLVFESNNYRNSWTGRDTSGDELSEGVYFYTLFRSDGKEQAGSVTILRQGE